MSPHPRTLMGSLTALIFGMIPTKFVAGKKVSNGPISKSHYNSQNTQAQNHVMGKRGIWPYRPCWSAVAFMGITSTRRRTHNCRPSNARALGEEEEHDAAAPGMDSEKGTEGFLAGLSNRRWHVRVAANLVVAMFQYQSREKLGLYMVWSEETEQTR